MSANNWATCPKCKRNRDAEIVAREKHLEFSYGRVPAGEYKTMGRDLDAMKERPIDQTLREDWELGTDPTGSFYVIYNCSCKTCGFAQSFKHDAKWEL